MRALCGINRITLEPENDADRALLFLYNQREGQRITVEFNIWNEVQKDSTFVEDICLYVNFELITEEQK